MVRNLEHKEPEGLSIQVAIPINERAEQCFLGACALGGFNEALALGAGEDHFFTEQGKTVWKGMVALDAAGKEVNELTVLEIKDIGLWLNDGIEKAGTSANVSYFYESLNEAAIRRRVFLRFQKTIELTSDLEVPVATLLSQIEQDFFEVTTKSARVKDQRESWAELLEMLNSAMGKGLPANGVMTGITGVDKIVRGMKPGSVNVAAARPGCGKTQLAIQIAMNVAKEGKHVAYFSYEMPWNQIASRAIACHTGLDIQHYLETGMVTDPNKLTEGVKEVSIMPLYIEDTVDKNIAMLRSEARRLAKEKDTKLFIVDYLQLVPPSRRNQSRVLEVSELSRSIKKAAMETNVPWLILAQMNRSIEERTGEPRLSDLKESGSIEQDADVVMFLHNPESDPEYTQLLVKKNRHGSTGKAGLTWTKWNGRFETAGRKERVISKSEMIANASKGLNGNRNSG